MAPSQMEHQQEQTLGQGYTHKKFNCSYSHKKLGMRLRQREDLNNKENTETNTPQQHNQEISKRPKQSSKGLFRPYALGADSPRKRKISRESESSDDDNSQESMASVSPSVSPAPYNQQQQPPIPVSTPITCPSPALSPNSYAQRLQRQRAALYMRYMQQFHSGNNMSPSTSQVIATPKTTYHPMGYPNVTAPIFNGC